MTGSAYLVGSEGDQDPYPPRQGGVDERFRAPGDQRGLLQREHRLSHVVVHDHFGLEVEHSSTGVQLV